MIRLDPFAAQGRFILSGAKRWMADLDDSHRALQPVPSGKTAGWLLGHMAVTGDFGRRICGLKPMCPKEWRAMFNPGTFPSTDASTYPAMAELRDTMVAVYRDLFANGPAASEEALTAPNPYTPASGAFATAGDFAAYLMTGHLGHHVGQLSAWHVAAGLGSTANAD
ncbi:hypothetical protein ARNL5_01234 [Anaerolineae bacterium]|nr:hypothetical protein ARNL5_01234 [Anaerolineae bacterium]